MTLQMHYQEKYEQGVEQGNRQSALRMIEDGDLPLEKILLRLLKADIFNSRILEEAVKNLVSMKFRLS